MATCSKCGYPVSGGVFTDQCFCEPNKMISWILPKVRSSDFSSVSNGSHPLANPPVMVARASLLGVQIPLGTDLLPVGAQIEPGDLWWHNTASRWESLGSFGSFGRYVSVVGGGDEILVIRQRGKEIHVVK